MALGLNDHEITTKWERENWQELTEFSGLCFTVSKPLIHLGERDLDDWVLSLDEPGFPEADVDTTVDFLAIEAVFVLPFLGAFFWHTLLVEADTDSGEAVLSIVNVAFLGEYVRFDFGETTTLLEEILVILSFAFFSWVISP